MRADDEDFIGLISAPRLDFDVSHLFATDFIDLRRCLIADLCKSRFAVTGGGLQGPTADAFALMDRFEKKLGEYPDNTRRAVIELAKDWRIDRVLRRLEAMLAVADKVTSLIVSGAGDVIEPSDGVIGIGSGGAYASSAAKALLTHSQLPAKEIVEAALRIAGEVCIYTNTNIRVETL